MPSALLCGNLDDKKRYFFFGDFACLTGHLRPFSVLENGSRNEDAPWQ
jgi:hypothetical protein